MELIESTAEAFREAIQDPGMVFGSAAFAELNRTKVDEVYFLLFKEKKVRLGLTAGRRGDALHSPFSAPFGGFVVLDEAISLPHIDAAIDALREWARAKGIRSLKVTLPPSIYGESLSTKFLNCFFRAGSVIVTLEVSHSFCLDQLTEDYPNQIWSCSRKNLKIALSNSMEFSLCSTEEEKKLAYQVIAINRQSRGFPLRMTWEQVRETAEILPADFFLVRDKAGAAVASAVVFRVTKDVVQVVYWGNTPESNGLKPMNFISYKVFDHYRQHRFRVVDIGPSSENSVPNLGLVDFKESIGCKASPKFSLVLEV